MPQSNCDNHLLPADTRTMQSANRQPHATPFRSALHRSSTAPNPGSPKVRVHVNEPHSSESNHGSALGGNHEGAITRPSRAKFDGGDDVAISATTGESAGLTDPIVLCGTTKNSPGLRAGTPSSMSRRRQASNRPILPLRVEIPPKGLFEPFIAGAFSTNDTTAPSPLSGMITPLSLSRHFATFTLLSGSTTPHTPVDQCIRAPLLPPELPRSTIPRRHIPGGSWATTPTEGVIPDFVYQDPRIGNCETMQLVRTPTLADAWQEPSATE